MTLDELIERLKAMRAESPLMGGTMVYICEDERDYLPIRRVSGDFDDNGAVVLICI